MSGVSKLDANLDADGRDRIALIHTAIDLSALTSWSVVPRAGSFVAFCGTVRDHAEGRSDVEALTYEAYEQPALRAMSELAAAARSRWPAVERLAIVHRLGRLGLGEIAVAVVVSAPHREESFAAARWLIDELKAAVPIWKQEHSSDGDDWGTGSSPIRAVPAPIATEA